MQILSSILTAAYQKATEIKSPPALVVLAETSREALHQYNNDSVTRPPIDSSFQSPFLGWDIRSVAQFVRDNAKGSMVDPGVFLIADEKTVEDGETLLLVQSTDLEQEQGKDPFTLESVRVAGEDASIEAVAVSVATKDVAELVSLVDGNGVLRASSSTPQPRKGGKAPKKQIGSASCAE